MMCKITGYAHLLFDQQYRLASEQICQLGYQPGEQYFLDREVTIDSRQVGRALAGSLINSMVIMAQLGVPSRLVSKRHIGDDDALKMVAESGLQPKLAASQIATGHCNILIDETGERTMLAYIGAASELGVEQLDPSAELSLLEGYLANFSAGQTLMKTVAQSPFALTLGHHALVSQQHELFSWLYHQKPRFIMGNLGEFQALLGTSSLSQTIAKLQHDNITALVSNGRHGAVSVHAGEQHDQAALNVEVKDTTGAGDALAGAWLAGNLLDASPTSSLKAAVFAAGQVVSQVGPRLTGDHAEHVVALLRE